MKTRSVRVTLAVALFIVAVVSCTATQPPVLVSEGLPGFWLGLWHGMISPITFFVSLFSKTIEIYAYPNTGGWYNLGFMLGIGGFSGGIFAGSRNRCKDKK